MCLQLTLAYPELPDGATRLLCVCNTLAANQAITRSGSHRGCSRPPAADRAAREAQLERVEKGVPFRPEWLTTGACSDPIAARHGANNQIKDVLRTGACSPSHHTGTREGAPC